MTKEQTGTGYDVMWLLSVTLGCIAIGCLVIPMLIIVGSASGEERPPYDRDEWGRWQLTDEYGPQGCRWDSRGIALRDAGAAWPDVLIVRDKPGRTCWVESLTFVDRYTGLQYAGSGSKAPVDHLVALSEAHRSGGWAWTSERKRKFSNDQLNLVPTTKRVNSSKSDRDPGGERGTPWLPSTLSARCWYAQKYVAVKAKWRLTMDADERRALDAIKEECAEAPLTFDQELAQMIVLIVNAENPVLSFSELNLEAIYRGSSKWKPVDLKPGVARHIFSRLLYEKTTMSVQSKNAISIFSGMNTGPVEYDPVKAMEYVAKHRNAIAYVPATTPLGDGVRVVPVVWGPLTMK